MHDGAAPKEPPPNLPRWAAAGGAEHRRWSCRGANQTGSRVLNKEWESTGARSPGVVRPGGGTFSLLSSGRQARRV